MKQESKLLTFEEFCEYLRIKPTMAKQLLGQPDCRYVVRIGSRILIHKELLDEELKKSAKYRLNMLRNK